MVIGKAPHLLVRQFHGHRAGFFLRKPRTREGGSDFRFKNAPSFRGDFFPTLRPQRLFRAKKEHPGVVRGRTETRLALMRGAVAVPVIRGGDDEVVSGEF